MSEGQTSNTHTPLLSGCLVALITPMTTTGSIDEEALRQLVQWHLKIGTHGLVPTGTTGESPVLSADEQHRVIEIVCDEVKGAIPVVAGCGSNNTHEALEHHAHAFDAGATAALHVTGYYNRPSQEGIYQHFKALNHLNPLPIIVYNIPARTNVDISVRTMAGNGCISTTGNVAPEICVQIQNACQRGDFPEAIALQQKLTPLHEALFLEPSPAGVKYACSRRGLCTDTVRLPMISPGADTRHAIDAALERIEISTAQ